MLTHTHTHTDKSSNWGCCGKFRVITNLKWHRRQTEREIESESERLSEAAEQQTSKVLPFLISPTVTKSECE